MTAAGALALSNRTDINMICCTAFLELWGQLDERVGVDMVLGRKLPQTSRDTAAQQDLSLSKIYGLTKFGCERRRGAASQVMRGLVLT